MKKQQFWSLVEESRKGRTHKYPAENIREQNRRYRELLEALSPPQLVEWRRCLERRMVEAYRRDLWAAAALIRDGCSERGFQYFRAWLIAQGRATFEAALRDPDTLTDNADLEKHEDAQYPAFLSIPGETYRARTRRNFPDLGVALPERPRGRRIVADPGEVNARNIDALAGRFPRLAEQFWREEWLTDREPEPSHPPPPLDAPPMDEDQFWELIEESRRRARRKRPPNGNEFFECQMEVMPDVLRKLSPTDLVRYDRRFADYCRRAYRWDLWGAAYWMHGGCGDDGFMDFRSTLLALGRELFFRVLDDPDSLAELVERKDVPSYLQLEGFQYLASRVYKQKTGYDTLPEAPDRRRGSTRPAGRKFDFVDDRTMRKRYPRLVEKWPEMGD